MFILSLYYNCMLAISVIVLSFCSLIKIPLLNWPWSVKIWLKSLPPQPSYRNCVQYLGQKPHKTRPGKPRTAGKKGNVWITDEIYTTLYVIRATAGSITLENTARYAGLLLAPQIHKKINNKKMLKKVEKSENLKK